jgi:hypothetical protein
MAVDRAIEKLGGPVATADFLGVRYQTVNNWQKKGFVGDLVHAYRLAKAANVDIADFVKDAEEARGASRPRRPREQ